MIADEDEPLGERRAVGLVASPPLDRLGIEELRGYIAGLRGEIVRAEAEIQRKDGIRNAADNVFRRQP